MRNSLRVAQVSEPPQFAGKLDLLMTFRHQLQLSASVHLSAARPESIDLPLNLKLVTIKYSKGQRLTSREKANWSGSQPKELAGWLDLAESSGQARSLANSPSSI